MARTRKKAVAKLNKTDLLTFDFHGQASHVYLIGLGGTGSQWARTICRTIWNMKQRRLHIPTLTFIDGDKIEIANVGRQMYVSADQGKYKAQVLAQRFSCAMGLAVEYINEYFEHSMLGNKYGALICGAVDNHYARAEIAKTLEHNRGCLWIDAGNHEKSGQVIIGNAVTPDKVWQSIDPDTKRCYGLPSPTLLFPDLLQPEQPNEPDQPVNPASCAERVVSNTQHMLINDQIGIIAGHYSYQILNREPLCHFATFTDMDTMSTRSLPITYETLASYLKPRD